MVGHRCAPKGSARMQDSDPQSPHSTSSCALQASPLEVAASPPPSNATRPPPPRSAPSHEHLEYGIFSAHAQQMESHSPNQQPKIQHSPAPMPQAATINDAFRTPSSTATAPRFAPPGEPHPTKHTTAILSTQLYHQESASNSATQRPEHVCSSPDRSPPQFPPPQLPQADIAPSPSAGTQPIASTASTAPTNTTPGTRKWCKRCGQLFASGNNLHQHLTSCRARRPAAPTDPPAPQSRKRKQPAVPTEPSTYSEFASAPPGKARRFTHHSPAIGAIDAVEYGGTIFYNTIPPNHDPEARARTHSRPACWH